MNYTVIILICVVLLLIYLLYKYISSTQNMAKGLVSLSSAPSVPISKLNNPNSINYYYEFWTFINALPASSVASTTYTNIVSRAGDLGVWLGSDNTLVLANTNSSGSITPNGILFTIINPFPLQKWVYVAINVVNHSTSANTLVECYINGKLVTTQPNQTMANSPSGGLNIGQSGVNGYITHLLRVPQNIDATTVWNHYVKGNGISGVTNFFSQYHIDMNVTKDQVLQRNVRLL